MKNFTFQTDHIFFKTSKFKLIVRLFSNSPNLKFQSNNIIYNNYYNNNNINNNNNKNFPILYDLVEKFLIRHPNIKYCTTYDYFYLYKNNF